MKWFWQKKPKDFGIIYLYPGCKVKDVSPNGDVLNRISVVADDVLEKDEGFFLFSPAEMLHEGMIVEIEIAEKMQRTPRSNYYLAKCTQCDHVQESYEIPFSQVFCDNCGNNSFEQINCDEWIRPKRRHKIMVIADSTNEDKFEYFESSKFIENSISISSPIRAGAKSISVAS